ncbi:MAG: hypothetical protein NTX33_18680, partial [Propionibacteriales bacterium]|nr:hypothetical protein [Propionibacteriales bacterium]
MSTTAKEATVFTLYTHNYKHFNPKVGTAVQTSIGSPRWPLRYALDFRISELMPSRSMLKLPYEAYADRYVAQLEEMGV